LVGLGGNWVAQVLRRFVMKRVLLMIVAAGAVVMVAGCKKKADETAGGGREREAKPATMRAARVEEAEAVGPDTGRGLVCWWKLEEGSGTTAADSSGKGHKGTLKGGMSFEGNSTEGRVGKALQFGGGDNYVEAEGYKGITGTAPRTVAAWIKTRSDRGEILAWGRDEGGGMFIFGHVEGRGRIGVTPEGGYLYMNAKTNDDAWHHVAAVVREGAPPNLHDDVEVFLDGERAIIHDIGILDLWPIDTPGELDVRIGKGFKGALDEVRIYERALSEEEIRMLFKGQ